MSGLRNWPRHLWHLEATSFFARAAMRQICMRSALLRSGESGVGGGRRRFCTPGLPGRIIRRCRNWPKVVI